MIQVQIAAELTATGVHGVRWVLVDALDIVLHDLAPPPVLTDVVAPGANAEPTAELDATVPPSRRPASLLWLLKSLALMLGLAGAWVTTQATLRPSAAAAVPGRAAAGWLQGTAPPIPPGLTLTPTALVSVEAVEAVQVVSAVSAVSVDPAASATLTAEAP